MEKNKILVVEDEAISREIFKTCLVDEYEVLIAENGEEAFVSLEKYNYNVAIILLDLRMPGMNEIQFLERRKKNPEIKNIPVIVITEFDEVENELKVLEEGADDVVYKPFDRRVLLKRVSNLIVMSKARMLNDENMILQEFINYKIKKIGDYLSDGVLFFEVSEYSKHLYVNEGLCKLLGYTKTEYQKLVNGNPYALVHVDDMEEIVEKVKIAAKKNGSLSCTFRMKRKNEKYQWLTVHANILEDGRGCKIFSGVFSDEDQIKNDFEKDELTGLCSSEAFEQIVNMFFKGNSEEATNNRMAALFMIDIDDFKSINDHFGHVYGDHVLIEIGEKIHSIFRDEDITAHVGGDEFCVFLTHKIPQEIIELRAKQICEAIKTKYKVAGEVVSSSCSVGVAIAPQHGNSYLQLYKNADKAQYLAKKSGKNKYIIFDSASE